MRIRKRKCPAIRSEGPMSEKASPLTLALERLTVFDVWKLLGLEGTAKRSCRSPFRNDRNASFSMISCAVPAVEHSENSRLILPI
jgi:hypothetical protein